ncbi:unnamed protein product [Aspergillus oryzae var. brunneus]|uniref:Unnamed protein product n=2 Tax=Aspergillus oryzae TaxID=5062 RepID=A0AAN4YBM5_ASPOZ|nr:unnamed protein product [Aspergillus oryzae]GMG44087.1 unnamed protein product [Aspergillus oryzae var. brunneus]
MAENTHLPLRVSARLDRFEEILAHEVGVLARDLLRFFPDHAGLTLQGLPVELDELGVTVVSDEAEGVDTKAIDVAKRARDTMAGHGPEQGVQGTGLLAEEVPSRVMGSGSLRDLIVTTRLDSVDEIREKNSVLDEEDGNVVANNICDSN